METKIIRNEPIEKGNGNQFGQVITNKSIGNYRFSLNEHLVLYEALKAFQEVLKQDVSKSKIKTAPELIERLVKWFKNIEFNQFIDINKFDSESLLKLVEQDFKMVLCFEVDEEDIPF